MKRTYSHMHRTDKYSQHSSITWSVLLNGWVLTYSLSGCQFESSCSNLKFRIRASFEPGVPWHSSHYRVLITSEMCTLYHKNIQSNTLYIYVLTTQLNHLVSLAKCLSVCLGTKLSWVRVRWSHLEYRFRACFEQRFLWNSGNYRCGFTLKRVRDMTRTYSQMHHTDKYSQHSSIIWPVWRNDWVLVYKLSGYRFESSWRHLNCRFHARFEQVVSWHWGNYRVWIHSETRTWHDKNIQSIAPYRQVVTTQLNHLASLGIWLSVSLGTKCFRVRVQL